MLFWAGVSTAALLVVLVAERIGWRPGVWVGKPLASLGFVAAAISGGALDHAYGRAITAGLVLAFAGDVLLIPQRRPAAFRAGVLSFLAGHIAYSAAFAIVGFDTRWLILATIAVGAAAVPILRWLAPHVPHDMRVAVLAYVVVISLMVATAAAAVGDGSEGIILIGAIAFYLSDLSVARDRFVTPAFFNRLWGLPLYYSAQFLLAATSLNR